MAINSTVVWSDSLQQQTRSAVARIPVTPSGRLSFKHAVLGYGHVDAVDLSEDRLVMHVQSDGNVVRFNDVEALLRAGWALD